MRAILQRKMPNSSRVMDAWRRAAQIDPRPHPPSEVLRGHQRSSPIGPMPSSAELLGFPRLATRSGKKLIERGLPTILADSSQRQRDQSVGCDKIGCVAPGWGSKEYERKKPRKMNRPNKEKRNILSRSLRDCLRESL